MDKKYQDYLQSDEWKAKKEMVFSVFWKHCQRCNSEKDIHVHHSTYKNIYNEDINDLYVLCKRCHEFLHELYWTEDLENNTMRFMNMKFTYWENSKKKYLKQKKYCDCIKQLLERYDPSKYDFEAFKIRCDRTIKLFDFLTMEIDSNTVK